ncbi:DedA family protein [bacterium]|nr:DedA family protein [bacterium]
MGDWLVNIFEWMSDLPAMLAYLTIFSISYLENVIPPVPGDMIIVFGGYMAGLGLLNPWAVVGLSTIGGILGFMTMFAIGVRVGTGLLDPNRFKWLPKQRILLVKSKLERWGFGLVAANRFLSGLRSVISLAVGMAHMPVRPTLIWCSISALVWTGLITAAGFYVGENWEVVGEYLRGYGVIITSIIVLFWLIQGIRYLIQRKKNNSTN